jgi:hypothetical protein
MASTIITILRRREYLGHTVNFKTTKASYDSKRVIHNDSDAQVVFENTHPAIINQETFNRVQQLRSGKRRKSKSGRVEPFSGLVYCADCKSKLYFSAGACLKENQDYYVCSGFRSKKVKCAHSHYIRVAVLQKLVLNYLAKARQYTQQHEADFVRLVRQDSAEQTQKELRRSEKQLAQWQDRVTELDTIIQRLYEDSVHGKLSDERFVKLSQGYEQEQKDLHVQAEELSQTIAAQEEQTVNVERFLKLIRKYSDVTELTPAMLHELIERIEVHTPDKSSGQRVVKVDIALSYIGVVSRLDFAALDAAEEASADGDSAGRQNLREVLGNLGKPLRFRPC